MNNRFTQRVLFYLAVANLAILGGGIYFTKSYPDFGRAALAFATGAIAIVNFFTIAFLVGSFSERGESLRKPIAVSTVLTYFSLMAMNIYYERATDKIDPFASTLLSSFTTTVGIVIAFYFGSSAYIEAKGRAEKKRETDDSPPN